MRYHVTLITHAKQIFVQENARISQDNQRKIIIQRYLRQTDFVRKEDGIELKHVLEKARV